MVKEHGNIIFYAPENEGPVQIEDLCIAVDISVNPKSRNFSTTTHTESSEEIRAVYHPDKSDEVTFLKGKRDELGNSMLTTFYAEDGNTGQFDNEGVCIRSINIDYQSWYTPLVKITFVDVRGSGLFAPTQNNKDKWKDKSLAKQFFNAFFIQPYPIFTLTYKGFLGKATRMKLYCLDMRHSYEAQTGNFIMETTFLGYHYGFLADIKMSFLRFAPYCKIGGREYWQGKQFHFVNGDDTETPMLTIDELYGKLISLQNDIDEEMRKNETAQETNSTLETFTKANEILALMKGDVFQFGYYIPSKKCLVYPSDQRYYSGDCNTIETYINLTIKPKIDAIKAALSEVNCVIDYPVITEYKVSNQTAFITQGSLNEFSVTLTDENNGIMEDVILLNTKYKDCNSVSILDFSSLYEGLEKYTRDKADHIKNSQNIIAEVVSNVVEQKLGFTPNMANFIRLISAHMETFMHCMYTCINSIVPGRNYNDYYRYTGLRDTADGTCYPFPLVTRNRQGKEEEYWPSKSHMGGILPEAELVKAMIEASFRSLETNEVATAVINATQNHTPLNITDYILNGKTNPYTAIRHTTDINDILFNILIRAIAFCRSQKDYIDEAAGAEAYNIASIFKNQEIRDILKRMDYDDFLRYLQNIPFGPYTAPYIEKDGKIYFASQYNEKIGGRELNMHFAPFRTAPLSYYTELINEVPRHSCPDYSDNGYLVDNIKTDEVFNREHKVLNKDKHPFVINIDDDRRILDSFHSQANQYRRDVLKDMTPREYIDKTIRINPLGNAILGDALDETFLVNYPSRIMRRYNQDEIDWKQRGGGVNAYMRPDDKIILGGNTLNSYMYSRHIAYEKVDRSKLSEYFVLGNYTKTPTTIYSLFGDKSYIDEKNEYIRAARFLGSLGFNIPKDSIQNITKEGVTVMPKGYVLYIGALMYLEDNKVSNILHNSPITKKLNCEVRRVFIEKFTDWVNGSFSYMDNMYSLTSREYDTLKSFFEENINNKVSYTKEDFENLIGNFRSRRFFEMYEQIAPRFEQNRDKSNKVVGFDLAYNAKDTSSVSMSMYNLSLLFDNVYIYSSGSGVYEYDNQDKNEPIGIDSSVLKAYFTQLVKSFRSLTEQEENAEKNARKSLEDEAYSDINQNSIYHYLKTLFDKWLCGEEEQNFRDFYDKFTIVDRSYNEIAGVKCLIDLQKYIRLICDEDVLTNGEYNVMRYLSQVLSENHFGFIPMSGYRFYKDNSEFESVFKPLPYSQMSEKNISSETTFMCVYMGRPSAYTKGLIDSLYDSDWFDIEELDGSTSTSLPNDFYTTDRKHFYKVPAFKVAVGNDKEHFVKKIGVNMNTPRSTDEAIQSVVNIGNMSPGTRVTGGQDLYSVYNNRSYDCTLDLMGNAQIQPFMYFQLCNLPIWNGTYRIDRITHEIGPGTFNTRVVGVKLAKAYPYFEEEQNFVPRYSSSRVYGPITGGMTDGNHFAEKINNRPVYLSDIPSVRPRFNWDLDETFKRLCINFGYEENYTGICTVAVCEAVIAGGIPFFTSNRFAKIMAPNMYKFGFKCIWDKKALPSNPINGKYPVFESPEPGDIALFFPVGTHKYGHAQIFGADGYWWSDCKQVKDYCEQGFYSNRVYIGQPFSIYRYDPIECPPEYLPE